MTIDELRDRYNYDRKSGKVTRKRKLGRWTAGTEVGTLHTYGHTDIQFLVWKHAGGKRPLTHLIWALETGKFPDPGVLIDHRNNNPLDNRWSNLREATSQHNNMNRRNWGKYPKGVSLTKCGRKFRARITVYGKTRMLGVYDDAHIAGAAYDRAAKWAFGEWSYQE